MLKSKQKLQLKLIDTGKIRHHLDQGTHKWYFSITDIIALLTESSDARNYWKVLKNRLKSTQKELVTKCNQLKMKSSDGKSYMADAADAHTMLQIIEIVSPQNVAIFSDWFAKIELQNHSNSISNSLALPSQILEKSTGRANENEISQKSNFSSNVTSEEINDEESEIPVDIYETDSMIVVKTFAAGVNPEDVSISVNSKNLFIRGKRINNKNISDDDYLYQELYWGTFSRSIDLKVEVEIERVEAIEHQGLLTITLLKLDKSRSRLVKIKSV